jgi:hypothetical protein
MTLGSKPSHSELIDWKSTLLSVIPAETRIQAVFEPELKTNRDAGVRRHDEPSLRLKPALRFLEGASHSNHPRERH